MVEWTGLKRDMHVAQMVRIKQCEGQNQTAAENPTEANGLFLGHRMTRGAVPRIANCFLRFSFRRAFEDLTVTDVTTNSRPARLICSLAFQLPTGGGQFN